MKEIDERCGRTVFIMISEQKNDILVRRTIMYRAGRSSVKPEQEDYYKRRDEWSLRLDDKILAD